MIPVWQRLVGVFMYLLPLSDAIPLGRYLLEELPILNFLLIPTIPFLFIKTKVLFGSLLIFLILFFGIIRNQEISYFIRFNALQAILINIILILATYGIEIIIKPLGSSLFIKGTFNTIFIIVLATTIFGIVKCLQGKEPDLPGISEAVRMQI